MAKVQRALSCILTLLILTVCMGGQAWADLSIDWSKQHARMNAATVGAATAGTTCNTTTPFKNLSTNDTDTAWLSSNYYVGFFYTPASDVTLCTKISFYMRTVNGTITSKTYTVRVWTTSGTSLDTEIGTSSGVTGNGAWSQSWQDYTLSGNVSLTGGTKYAITIDQGGTDASNHVRMGYISSASDGEVNLASWSNLKAQTNSEATLECNVKLYRLE